MVMEARGIYRERKGWGDQDSAHVKYDEHQELDVPEDRYRARGYQPPCVPKETALIRRDQDRLFNESGRTFPIVPHDGTIVNGS